MFSMTFLFKKKMVHIQISMKYIRRGWFQPKNKRIFNIHDVMQFFPNLYMYIVLCYFFIGFQLTVTLTLVPKLWSSWRITSVIAVTANLVDG